MDLESLRNRLAAVIAPDKLSSWGTGKNKGIQDLYTEVIEGDCIIPEEGDLVRQTSPIFIQVLYQNLGRLFELFEEKQVFHKSGEKRTRVLPASLGEKGIVGEDPLETAQRAVAEELQEMPLSAANAIITLIKSWTEDTDARSYPGLRTRSNNTLLQMSLPPDQGEPKPFVEDDGKKITFFNWRELK